MYKVLLIDDEKLVVQSLKYTIDWRANGFEIVDVAFNGIEGYEKIKRQSPDLVITDIRMPGMDGLELIRMCKEQGCDTSFIIMSGYKDFEYAKKAIRYSALDYCLKPFDSAEIVETLDKFNERQLAKKAILPKELLHLSHTLHSTPKPSDSTFGKILSYIDEHFKEDISLQSVSDNLNLNSSYVSQLFRKEGNCTFLQYLTKKRIAYACMLLKHTSASIQKVGEEAGFMDYFTFAKIFKKIMGQTATQYREERANETEGE